MLLSPWWPYIWQSEYSVISTVPHWWAGQRWFSGSTSKNWRAEVTLVNIQPDSLTSVERTEIHSECRENTNPQISLLPHWYLLPSSKKIIVGQDSTAVLPFHNREAMSAARKASPVPVFPHPLPFSLSLKPWGTLISSEKPGRRSLLSTMLRSNRVRSKPGPPPTPFPVCCSLLIRENFLESSSPYSGIQFLWVCQGSEDRWFKSMGVECRTCNSSSSETRSHTSSSPEPACHQPALPICLPPLAMASVACHSWHC